MPDQINTAKDPNNLGARTTLRRRLVAVALGTLIALAAVLVLASAAVLVLTAFFSTVALPAILAAAIVAAGPVVPFIALGVGLAVLIGSAVGTLLYYRRAVAIADAQEQTGELGAGIEHPIGGLSAVGPGSHSVGLSVVGWIVARISSLITNFSVARPDPPLNSADYLTHGVEPKFSPRNDARGAATGAVRKDSGAFDLAVAVAPQTAPKSKNPGGKTTPVAK